MSIKRKLSHSLISPLSKTSSNDEDDLDYYNNIIYINKASIKNVLYANKQIKHHQANFIIDLSYDFGTNGNGVFFNLDIT